MSRAAQDLQRFVGLMQPQGLELIQTIALRTGLARRDEAPETYLLVLRVLKQAGGSTGPLVNAERLLELSSTGQQSLAAGLAGVLAESLDAEEINSILPDGLRGSVNQRLAEFVAAQPDPTDLLRELGYARLRQEAERLGTSREQLARLDTAGLARLVLRQARVHRSVSPCVLYRGRARRCRPGTKPPAAGCQRYGSYGKWHGSYRCNRAYPPVLGCYLVHAQPR